jgi:hypothetical protein
MMTEIIDHLSVTMLLGTCLYGSVVVRSVTDRCRQLVEGTRQQ